MGSALVYDHIRPRLLGGFDFSEVYHWLQTSDQDVVVDVGCGTGCALEYVKSFKAYHGFDIDPRSLGIHRKKYPRENIFLHARTLQREDILSIKPTKGILMGLLHHLTDPEVISLLDILGDGRYIQRAITLDVAYQKGRWINNILARLDRGRFARSESGYRALINESTFKIATQRYISCGNHLASYWAACLIPK
jgi:SAM-dependent methyltransferase